MAAKTDYIAVFDSGLGGISVLRHLLRKLPGVLRHLYVLLIVAVSFVIFNAATMAQVWEDLRGMFGEFD